MKWVRFPKILFWQEPTLDPPGQIIGRATQAMLSMFLAFGLGAGAPFSSPQFYHFPRNYQLPYRIIHSVVN